MALKLLQPGLQPAGQFDLKDPTPGSSSQTIYGGEYVELTASTDYAAHDVTQSMSPATYMEPGVRTTPNSGSARFGGLADDGISGYGTSFGTLIGATVGQGTGFGTLSTTGVVVIGPQTTTGSGKVTVWHAPGLYGISGRPATDAGTNPLSGLAVNSVVDAESGTGFLGQAAAGDAAVGVTVGEVKDQSMVSTSTYAATGTASTEFYAIYMTAINGPSVVN